MSCSGTLRRFCRTPWGCVQSVTADPALNTDRTSVMAVFCQHSILRQRIPGSLLPSCDRNHDRTTEERENSPGKERQSGVVLFSIREFCYRNVSFNAPRTHTLLNSHNYMIKAAFRDQVKDLYMEYTIYLHASISFVFILNYVHKQI